MRKLKGELLALIIVSKDGPQESSNGIDPISSAKTEWGHIRTTYQ